LEVSSFLINLRQVVRIVLNPAAAADPIRAGGSGLISASMRDLRRPASS